MDVNFNDLTIGEMEEIEEISGVPLSELGDGNVPIKAIKAIVFVTARRTDPTFTLEDAANIKLADFGAQADTDPTSAAD